MESMIILGIESSCDETAAAIVEDGRRLLSNVVNSQVDIHAEYGGVVPEVAARSHIEVINPVIRQAMREANVSWDDIDAIAVANAPGLVGSLLVGVLAARTLAELHQKPLYPVHHVEGHIYANFIVMNSSADDLHLPNRQPTFPMLALAVSGLHSQLMLFEDHGKYRLLGETLDDAVGEAFDKVARMLGLPYPGGPAIAQTALSGDPLKYVLPKAKLKSPYDFSFSGLKTAVLRSIQRDVGVDHTFPSRDLPGRLNDAQRADFAASFQHTAVSTLVDATLKAVREYTPSSIVIAGGAASNQELRRQLSQRLPMPIEYAPMSLCTDNAAMIAALGFYRAQIVAPTAVDDVSVYPSLSMNQTIWNA
ncbi:tRNA (adenosine(37)-N6)-threonylcarbamoyltransferase complex transferase subunit TsaD [Candidatus Saccharibacteria bacterium]|nr:tRNA (adenosine(37)-N6)-threonylcarbamoyltransferase complex transferase subunit TsaD [Candidatus Saccharibacteria bacterium]